MDENQLAQLRDIIGALLAQTRVDNVDWEWREDGDYVCATLANGEIVVSKDNDFDTEIQIYDTDSNILVKVNTGYRIYASLKADADELYQLARSSALQLDFKLESILREISF